MPPRQPPIRRKLFGSPDPAETTKWLDEQLNNDLNEQIAKWGFDFRADRPLDEPSASIEYEPVDLNSVPAFYHPKEIKGQSPIKTIFKKRKIIVEEHSQKSPADETPIDEATILERPTDIGFTSPMKLRRRPQPIEIHSEKLKQTKLSGDFVQVYKKKPTDKSRSLDLKGSGDRPRLRARGKLFARDQSTSVEPSTSAAAHSDAEENGHTDSENEVEIRSPQSMSRLRRSTMNRL